MQEGLNKNTVAHFDPSWVSVLDESIQEWINRYTCPGWTLVLRKPHPFGNKYHKINNNNNNNNNNHLYYLEFRACELRIFAMYLSFTCEGIRTRC